MVQIGHEVSDIKAEALHNDEIRTVRLSDYRGKWLVLICYPGDFTFVCPTELEEAALYYDEFEKLGVQILSISTDTVFVHKAWKDNSPAISKVRFPMVADPTGKLCRELGTYVEEEGHSLRGTFIIDPDGILRALEINDNSIGRSTRELLRKVQAAKFVREHTGQVCPASWEPGKEALTTGLDMVGKI